MVYVADSTNHVIRQIVVATGLVSTLSGRGTPGFQNVGSGKTKAAMFYFPSDIVVTPKGLLLSKLIPCHTTMDSLHFLAV